MSAEDTTDQVIKQSISLESIFILMFASLELLEGFTNREKAGMVESTNKGRDGIIQDALIKFCIEKTRLAEDLVELSRKIKLMRKQDDSLLDIDNIMAQSLQLRGACS